MAEQIRCRMVARESLGETAELLALKPAQHPPPLFVAQNLCKFPVAVCKQGAICQQLIAFRPIDTAKRQQIFLREMKIEDRTLALDGGPAGKDRGDMGLVW